MTIILTASCFKWQSAKGMEKPVKLYLKDYLFMNSWEVSPVLHVRMTSLTWLFLLSVALPSSRCRSCWVGSWRWCSSCQLRLCSYGYPSKDHASCSPVSQCMIYWQQRSFDQKDSSLHLHSNMQLSASNQTLYQGIYTKDIPSVKANNDLKSFPIQWDHLWRFP